ncbi:MAG: polysaccharide pyruvyl transferase family protein [Planctomycetaceae bacterium]|nr:polysaccharide pyruvyl transferase family protein [Planctomycetaceae bacterium]
MDRRTFLQAAVTAAASSASAWAHPGGTSRKPRVLLRSSWQTVNIGDIAHTPGVLALLEKSFPEAEVWLWPSDIRNGVEELLRARFPKLKIVQGQEAIREALAECDFLLHGSGPSLVAQKDVARWHAETGKPFGVWGITLGEVAQSVRDLLSAADFVFFRDTVSLATAKQQGIASPVMKFGPDGAFNVDLTNDAAAEKFLAEHELVEGQFLCCIPRLRYTPYWKIKGREFDAAKHARNEELREHDHAPLREAIVAVVRQTAHKVLLCPEDASQMEVGRQNLYDPLPEDVKERVVWRENYWLTDEALSTYRRSAGLFGLEMHSPIMCVGNGIPALVGRFAEQTSKGFMWRDIGLGNWLFDLDIAKERDAIQPAVLSLVREREQALKQVEQARSFVRETQLRNLETLRDSLSRIQI